MPKRNKVFSLLLSIFFFSFPLISCGDEPGFAKYTPDVFLCDLTYDQSEWIIKGIQKENGNRIAEIPDMIDGKPVTQILSLDYRPNNEETSLHFTEIGIISIGKNVKTLSPYVFRDMLGLTQVLFAQDSQLEKIEQGAFAGCTNLSSLVLPDSLKYLEGETFNGCTNLMSLYIPKNLEVFNRSFNCGITTLSIDEENAFYSVVDNVLYNKDKTALEYYPAKKFDEAFTVLESTTQIMGVAFSGCKNLKTVNLGNVTKVDRQAFAGCENITTITADHLSIVDDNPFQDTAWFKNYVGGEIFLGKCLLSYTKFAFALDLTGYTSIAPYAFKGHTDLHRITFDNELINIGEGAFMDCTNLYEVIFYNPSRMVFISKDSFKNNATNRFFKVHESLFNDYATYNNYATNEFWQPYKDSIKTFN